MASLGVAVLAFDTADFRAHPSADAFVAHVAARVGEARCAVLGYSMAGCLVAPLARALGARLDVVVLLDPVYSGKV